MPPTYIADIASYQHGLALAALRADCAAVEIKCTQGSSYYNPDYVHWLPESRAAALIPVAYHYIDGAAPAAQAANLAAHILDKNVRVMLDAEQGMIGLPHALEVADAIRCAGMIPQLLYLSRSQWQAVGSPPLADALASRGMHLINAAYASTAAGSPLGLYPGDNAAAWDSYGGAEPSLLQFTDSALEGGFRIDMNAYRGTPAQLAALLDTPLPTPLSVPPPAPTAAVFVVLSTGTWGPRVAALQQALNFVNCPCGADDGKFGTRTRDAVLAFQRRYGLAIDGKFGEESNGRMVARVEQIQRALAADGYQPGPVDGIPGPNTRGATRRAQGAHHLAQDEVVGPNTSKALGISYP